MTKIEWCDVSWNPITGCTPISEGCRNCYAKRMATRLKGRFGYPADDPFRVTFHPDRLDEPFKWKKPRRVFVSSMGDLFHEDVDFKWLPRIFNMVFRTPHTYIYLTKRPQRMAEWIDKWRDYFGGLLAPNLSRIWLGVTVEDNTTRWRIEELLKIPAVVRFVSVEPMLGPIDFHLNNELPDSNGCYEDIRHNLHWVICGAETGPGKRPMDLEWAYDLQRQCGDAGVPFFFKKDSDRELPAGFRREYPIDDMVNQLEKELRL
jgi:protein gp37